MANQLLLKRSSVASKVPLTSDLALGELGMNTYDGKLYLKKNDGADAIVEIGPVYTVAGRVGNITLSTSDISGYGAVDDVTFTLNDNTDPTKIAKFELSGITTATTRTYTLPNLTGALATIGSLTQTFSGTTTFSAATVTVGSSTATSTYGLGTGATLSGSTKTLNIGTAGVSGSTTNINIGSATSTTTTTIQGTVSFPGTVTAVTQTVTDNTTNVATTAFVRKNTGSLNGFTFVNANTTLTVTNMGQQIQLGGSTASQVLTLPSGATCWLGAQIQIVNHSTQTWAVSCQGSDFLYNPPVIGGTTTQTINLAPGDSLILVSRGSTEWDIIGGTKSVWMSSAPSFSYAISAPGATFTTSGTIAALTVVDTGGNGSNIKLTGNGGTTPSKTIRANSGAFQIINNAYTTAIMSMDDSGNVTFTGSITGNSVNTGSATITGGTINGTSIGATTASTGAFTTGSFSSTLSVIGGATFQAAVTNFTASNAGLELGSLSASNTPYIDFHSSGNSIDFDARIIASGGTGSTGNGALQIIASQINGTFFNSSVNAAVAAAGTTQGTGTALTTAIAVVTSGTGGVVLPSAAAGMLVTVVNTLGSAINVYPASGASIDALAANAAFSLGTLAKIEFVAVSATKWYALTAVYA